MPDMRRGRSKPPVVENDRAFYHGEVIDPLREPLKKKVAGSFSKLPVLPRLEMLRRNALLLKGGRWSPPADDRTLVRKTVGAAR